MEKSEKMGTVNEEADILSMFGLTAMQTKILFSIENLLVQNDIQNSKNNKETKQQWLSEWSAFIIEYLTRAFHNEPSRLMTREEVLDAITQEKLSAINNTWYYLIMLEATLFIPYTPIGKDKNNDKLYSKLKYEEQTSAIKELVRENVIMDEVFVDRFKKTYSKSISKITGKGTKIAFAIVTTIAITAMVAATAGILSGPIAVTLYGSQFVGLSGAALTSACLAMAGGGAIAAGGAGMAGGVFTIVGGGALLGFATGGAGVGAITLFVASAPELALTQAAKLEVVLKEIILNAQKDIECAQNVLENYKNQIANLHSELAKMELERGEDKTTITNMKETIEYMEKAYKDISKFLSSYKVGAEFQDKENWGNEDEDPTYNN